LSNTSSVVDPDPAIQKLFARYNPDSYSNFISEITIFSNRIMQHIGKDLKI
jgi:hypothetical protein